MDTNNEILDAIEILADKKIEDNITKVLTGICTSVNINKNTCVMDSNGVSGTVYFYGSPPEVNGLYRIFVPSNDMSRSFIVVPPKFTVNPNLLDNWYFGNPVNQRGLTSYTGNVYYIDRWRSWDGDSASLSVVSGGIKIAGTLYQYFESAVLEELFGKTVTISLLFADGILYTDSFALKRADWYTVPIKAHGLDSVQFGINNNNFGNANNNFLRVQPATIGTLSDTILAAKFELGSQQTLAHLENGTWALNEIPKYEDMLSNCQRYTFNVVNSDDNYEILGGGFAMNTSLFFCFIPTPVTLRGKPTVKYSGSFRAVRNTNAADGIVINSISVDHASSNGVSVVCVDATSSFEVGEYYTLWCIPAEETNSLILSADL